LNQANAEAGIYSVYSSLQFNGVLGASATVNLALLSEAGRVGNVNRDPERLQFDDALVNSTNSNILTQWEDLYKIVFRANQVITNVPDIDMNETAKKEILGEAYFLRGLAMFWISTTFNEGNVPYPLISPTSLEEARFSIEERSFVINQIIEDLLTAQTNLKDRLNWASERLEGRATWGAVTSMLGKVYLYEENFTRAQEEFFKVIDSGEYALTPNIEDNFTEEGEFNSESIFEVQFFANIDNGGNFGDGEGSQPNESTLRPVLWTRGNGGFGFVFASHFISSLYRNEVIDPDSPLNTAPVTVYNTGYKPDNSAEQNEAFIEEVPRTFSVRSEASMAYEGDGSLFYTNSTRENFVRVLSRAQVKKFGNWKLVSEPRNSGINERVIRLADVYLMYAEALLREQGDAGITEALSYINQVRLRSGLVPLEELFQGVPTPPIIKNTFPDFTDMEIQALIPEVHPSLLIQPQGLTATNILRHLFNKERPAEFAWEGRGICWQDLRRRPAEIGDGVQRIQELGDVLYTTTTLGVMPFEMDPDFIENSLQDFRFRKVNFSQDDYYFPIPAQEILQNPDLGGN